MSGGKRVRVVVRTRPTANFAHDVIKLEEDGKTISIHLGKNADQLKGFINNQQQDWTFPMDGVLHNATQEVVYDSCARDLVSHLMSGFSATVLAYGETGAGKTYTMCGPANSYRARGVIPRAIAQVFAAVRENQEFAYSVRITYMEIYNEVIYDLLTTLPDTTSPSPASPPPTLTISEDARGGVSVKGLTSRLAQCEEEALNMLFEGETNRTIAEHSLNKHSSRSHCIFTITVEARSRAQSGAEYMVSRLNLVDLAGSERLSKTSSTGATEKEAMYINRSLSFLEQVTVALADSRRGHIPYRQSKLTHILRDSLGGNCHTVLIANVWAEAAQIPETLSTLRFASRVKCIHTNPVKNIVTDPQLLARQYEKEIHSLKQELAMHNTMLNRGPVTYDPLSEHEVEEIRRQVHGYLRGSLTDIPLVSVLQVKEAFSQFKTIVESLESSHPPNSHHYTGTLPHTPTLPPSSSHTATSSKSKKEKAQPTSVQPDSTHRLGDTHESGLGLGTAPPSQKHAASPAAAVKKVKAVARGESRQRDSTKSTASTKPLESSVTSLEEKEEGQEEPPPSEVSGHVTRPSTPPPKSEAFEQFKKGRGSEISKILVANKGTLQQKKKEAVELSTSINAIKKKMDELRGALSEYEGGGEGVSGDSGEVVMEEEQFDALSKLKQLKATYREQYDSLQAVRQEVVYCSQYVDQSREKLLEEFEKWYRASFIGEGVEQERGRMEEHTHYEHEDFDTLQMALTKGSPSTAAFYTAHLRTEKRGYHSHPGPPQGRRRPGLITSTLKN